jgi:Fic family protein
MEATVSADYPAAGPERYRTEAEKAERAAANLARLHAEVVRLVDQGTVALAPAGLQGLHRVAVAGLYRCGGQYRDGPVWVLGTRRLPPPAGDVPRLVEEACEYVNDAAHTAVHAAAYLAWRLKHTQPWLGANGRVSRAAARLLLAVRLRVPGWLLPAGPGTPGPAYYRALRAADAAWERGRLDVGEMERVLLPALFGTPAGG